MILDVRIEKIWDNIDDWEHWKWIKITPAQVATNKKEESQQKDSAWIEAAQASSG